MEFIIKAKDGAIPCLVTIDEDNGKYMLRNSDTSGEVFQNKEQLIQWIESEWYPEFFEDEDAYSQLLTMIRGNFDEI
ncbi:hypothetical protein DS745_01405 [Anaerobacillus alkaliphilus]|uniref:Threonine dehydratase n=1 Tax=Anaerobacillus alkaliphilus TaxID=1548597 RepID=A0A4Q0VXF4_9BACI|nr:hypothetical protein [Anaerobacillus alkaliphilus]RXJ04072.1 hypothetical protein DS745_01405 [Anaerobacillus alkaliphilus]